MFEMNFGLNDEQVKKAAKWIEQQENFERKKQGLSSTESPYYGAIGGELTYSFTPTSLGIIEKIKHSGTGSEIDLTEYDLW